MHPIRVVEQGNYHVIVVIEYYTASHDINAVLSEYPLS